MPKTPRRGPRIAEIADHRDGAGRSIDGYVDGEPDLSKVLGTLYSLVRRRWKLVLGLWAAVLIPAVLYAVGAVPSYTARGAVQVNDGSGLLGSNPLVDIMGGGSQAEVQTEVEIIKRREFLAGVLTGLNLQIVDPSQSELVTLDLSVAIGGASPLSSALRSTREAASAASVRPGVFTPVPLRLTAISPSELEVRVGEDRGDPVMLKIGERMSHDLVALEFRSPPLNVGESVELLLLPEGELLESYAGRIRVSGVGNVREPTNIVQVAVTDNDRETARAIVQSIMDRYLAKNLEWQSKSASQAADFIEKQLEEVRRSLLDAEERLKDFSKEQGAVQLDTQARVAIENSSVLEAQRVSIELQERTITSVLTRLKSGKGAHANVTSNFFDDPVLAASVQALTQAETEYEVLRASLTSEHPRVAEMQRGLEFQRAEVAKLLRSARKNLSYQRAQLEGELDRSSELMAHYPETQLELVRLTREAKVSENLYTLLLEKYEEAEIMKAATTTDKRIVDAASLPHRKSSPQRGRLLVMGLLGGFALGIGAAVVAHLLQRRLDTVEAVRELTPFPTYGTVPLIEEGADGEHRLAVSEIWESLHGAAPEAFRALGVSVSLLPSDGQSGRLIMVTSSQPGEGKSTIASNLAVSLARMNNRVLVIDLDLRKPVQHRVWGLPRAPGYSDLVGQGGSAADLTKVAHSELAGGTATVLTAGTRLPDTVAAIMAPTLGNLFEQWRGEFDFVIVDSPPAFVAETVALARYADLVMLVARPGVIERPNLQHAIESLERTDVPRALVLNAVGRQHTDYYYGSGYYSYGAKYAEAESGTPGDSGPYKNIA